MIGWIILVVFALLLAASIFFKFLRIFLKVVIFIGVGLSIALFVFGVLVFTDANEFKNRYPVEASKYFLVQEGEILAGIRALDMSDPEYYEGYELAEFHDMLYAGDYASVLGTDYKLFIFDMENFDDISSLELPGYDVVLDKDEIDEIVAGEDGFRIVSQKLYDNLNDSVRSVIEFDSFHDGLVARMAGQPDIKVVIFGLLLNEKAGYDIVPFLVDGIKYGSIKIYPESFMFKAIRYIPEDLLESALKKVEDGTS